MSERGKPDTLTAAEAIEIINKISDVSVLRGWLERDKRPTVQLAAKDRIVTLQPAPLQYIKDDPYREMRKAASEFMQKAITLKATYNYINARTFTDKVLELIPDHKDALALQKELKEIIAKRAKHPCAKCTHFRCFEANPQADQGRCLKDGEPGRLTETRFSCGDFERKKD